MPLAIRYPRAPLAVLLPAILSAGCYGFVEPEYRGHSPAYVALYVTHHDNGITRGSLQVDATVNGGQSAARTRNAVIGDTLWVLGVPVRPTIAANGELRYEYHGSMSRDEYLAHSGEVRLPTFQGVRPLPALRLWRGGVAGPDTIQAAAGADAVRLEMLKASAAANPEPTYHLWQASPTQHQSATAVRLTADAPAPAAIAMPTAFLAFNGDHAPLFVLQRHTASRSDPSEGGTQLVIVVHEYARRVVRRAP